MGEIIMVESEWIDISIPLGKEIPQLPLEPSDGNLPGSRVERFFDVEKGDKVMMSRIEMDSHDGTHIDSPLHFIKGGSSIDEMPTGTGVGPARVIEINNEKEITVQELQPYRIRKGERILFKTRNSPRMYATRVHKGDYVAITPDSANCLADMGISPVGLDYLTIASMNPPENTNIVHLAFLSKGIYILEAINLDGIPPGNYELICLPLRLDKGDAGPCRAVIRPIG
jgi:arylformamidase